MTKNGPRERWPAKRCVLIVDPYRDLRETLGDIVIRWGYVPLLAANGHEALSLARARSPWAVVSEILLQDIDPKDLLGELRRYSEIDRPVFIALTSWCRLEDRLRAGRAGFDRFLLKPADLDQLRQLLVDLAPPRLPAPGVAGPVEPRLEAPTPSFDGSPA